MNSDNVVALICNNAVITELINSKLVLLRDIDKVEHSNTIDAIQCITEKMPNIIILYAESNDSKRIKLVSEIKQNPNLGHIPIILISEKCSPEYLVEMFDAGISDLITAPVKEHELLFRVMWNIQKNEEYIHSELQNRFLANLGIAQKDTGFYSEKYAEEFLSGQVDYAIENKKQACVMYIEAEAADGSEKESDEFSKVIKKSIRLNDWVGLAGKNKYYVFFQKTKLNGTFAIFERLKKNSGFDYKISASVVEVADKPFDKLGEFLKNSIQKSEDGGSSLIIASEMMIKQNKANNQPVIKDEEINRAFKQIIENNKSEIVQEISKAKEKTVVDSIVPDVEDMVDKNEDIEIRNAVAFKQVYKTKCKIILEPAFKKYKSRVESKEQYVFVDYKVDFDESYFHITKGANELILSLKYMGLSTVIIETSQIFNNRIKDSDKVEAEITKIDNKFITFILEELINSIMAC